MKQTIRESILQKKEILNGILDDGYVEKVDEAGRILVSALQCGGKILLAGNGGSAADAQHFAGEMIGRFMFDRAALPAVSLCADPSVLTCIANDYGYGHVFARQLEGIGKKGDVFIPISTSGNSENLIEAVQAARNLQITTIGFLGKDGGRMKAMCDLAVIVPSNDTPRIQELHTFTVHVLCDYVERSIFEDCKNADRETAHG